MITYLVLSQCLDATEDYMKATKLKPNSLAGLMRLGSIEITIPDEVNPRAQS